MQIVSLQLQINELKKIIFGSRNEKFVHSSDNSLQLALFPNDKIGEQEIERITPVKAHEKVQSSLRVNHPGRNPLPESLRREVIELMPLENVSHLQPIGQEITEVLHYKIGELFVKQYVRPEYLRPTQDGLNAVRIIAALPCQPLPKAIVGASLLSHLMISKFVDHLPIYRQLEIFKRQQVTIDHTTVSGWIKQGCNLLQPLYDLHTREILQAKYLSVDETHIKVLDKNKKATTHKGFYWVYFDTVNKLALFDYQPGRGGIYPQAMLSNYKGFLQSDGYVVYDGFDKIEGITTLGCWAHARRKFFEAKDYDPENAEAILSQIQQLYAVEKHCTDNNFTPEQIKDYRTQYCIPILHNLHGHLQELLPQILPKSPLGEALQYTLARWNKLCAYTTNGILRIDNNLVENSIRPIALGRKNYLFAGSHDAAQDAAMLYSFFATCKFHNLNPQTWLEDIFCKIRNTPKENLKELLPQNYTTITT